MGKKTIRLLTEYSLKATPKVNATVRFETAYTDLLVAILTYSATYECWSSGFKPVFECFLILSNAYRAIKMKRRAIMNIDIIT